MREVTSIKCKNSDTTSIDKCTDNYSHLIAQHSMAGWPSQGHSELSLLTSIFQGQVTEISYAVQGRLQLHVYLLHTLDCIPATHTGLYTCYTHWTVYLLHTLDCIPATHTGLYTCYTHWTVYLLHTLDCIPATHTGLYTCYTHWTVYLLHTLDCKMSLLNLCVIST